MAEGTAFSIRSLIGCARQILVSPDSYYSGMPKSGGYVEPMIFVTVMGLLAGLLGTALSMFTLGTISGIQIGLGSVIVMPVAAFIGSFVFAFIMWAVWKLMGSRENYETAYRAVSATMVIMPVSAVVGMIPYFGTVVVNMWLIWMMILASIHVHQLDRQKSLTVIGILGIIMLMVNLSGEHSQRVMVERYSNLNERMREFEKLTPEEQEAITGEFLRGMEEGPKTGAQ